MMSDRRRGARRLILALCVLLAASPLMAEDIGALRQDAKRGDVLAQTRLCLAYLFGLEGVRQDDSLAALWCRRGAEQGNAYSQWCLGAMYNEGRGVPQDYELAVIWFRRGAEQGEVFAQAALGSMYFLGHGVWKDYAHAFAWLTVAVQWLELRELREVWEGLKNKRAWLAEYAGDVKNLRGKALAGAIAVDAFTQAIHLGAAYRKRYGPFGEVGVAYRERWGISGRVRNGLLAR